MTSQAERVLAFVSAFCAETRSEPSIDWIALGIGCKLSTSGDKHLRATINRLVRDGKLKVTPAPAHRVKLYRVAGN